MACFALGSCLVMALGMAGCISDRPDGGGIRFDQPVLGARESYAGFDYGGPKRREAKKTYTGNTMTLEVIEVRGDSVTLSQERCYAQDSSCTTAILKVDRAGGRVDVSEDGWSELETVNLFPSGIFTDSARVMEFTDYVPEAEGPAVGTAPEYRLAGKTYRNVTVMVDPGGIPVDVGGRVLIVSRENRLIELYRYHVFGTDGGWEIRE